MKKRYLKTVEDLIALKDTDTKIYSEDEDADFYYKFVNGYFCRFDDCGSARFNDTILLTKDEDDERYYILEEETEQEVTADDIGKLCRFWDDDMTFYRIGKLEGINKIEKNNKVCYLYKTETSNAYQHCRRLTTSEITNLI